ncbi:duf455 domain containing protein [Grosmannia clavigera kw1407]|uniref:Duf455 domain containing protein n=1 Tax=Grosmannia clavigera (strain kw1407 / UAMH 11150) TaxID=655863 RepID=F0XI49_GROCL|nr:duf455 domain containing protein [Grosmannia clavigera kw1407]EFX02812.1 duf455 domain containing protein [Grosmannia clavigera kw1407]
MRLWGEVHLEDGRLERLSREPFYEQVGADARNEDQNEDQGEEDDDLDNTPLPSCHPVTFVPEDRYRMACPREDWGLFEPAAGRATGGLNTLTVATYNVLGASAWPSSRARVPLLVDSILEAGAMADVLVLAEVTDDVLSELLADDGVRTAFPFASHGPPDQEDMPPLPRLFNSVVLSRRPFVWSWVAFAQAHKGALVARWGEMSEDEEDEDEVEDKKPKLVVAAVHLTHGLIGDAVTCKRAEALRLLRHLRRYHSSADVFVAGNVNVQAVGHGFDDLFAREGFVDLWRRQSDKAELDGEQGATYDLLHNNRPQWLVRIFVRQASEEAQNADSRRLRIVDAKLFGLSAAGSDTTASESFASDYWDLRCVVERVEGEGCDDGEDKGSKKETETETETETEIELTNKQLAISNEVKLVPVQVPAGLLADATALDRALVVLEAMPSDEEVEQRREALALLQRILMAEKSNGGAESASSPPRLPRQLVVVPVGSYGLGVWTLTSEMDCLCIGVYAATTFFAIATQRLRAAGQGS